MRLLSVRTDLHQDLATQISQDRDNIQELDSEGGEVQLDRMKGKCESNDLEKRKRPSFDDADNDDEVEEVEWFNARTFLRQIAKRQKKESEPQQTVDGDKNKIFDLKETMVQRQNLLPGLGISDEGLKRNIEPSSPKKEPVTKAFQEPLTATLKLSNRMVDGVKTVCQICTSTETFVNMRCHTKKAHGIVITEYRRMHGELERHMLEAVYHKCQICEKVILLESDCINTHVKTHSKVLTMREYSARYLVLKKPGERKRNHSVRKSEKEIDCESKSVHGASSEKYNNFSAEQLLIELESLLASF